MADHFPWIMAQDPSLAVVLWGQLFCFPILSVTLIPYSMVFQLHHHSLWGKCHPGDVFSFFSGKSLEQHSLCNPGCSFSIVTDLDFFDITLHIHSISELIRPLLVARTREHSESWLKPKREFISWYNWMPREQNCIQADISRHSKKSVTCKRFLPISWFFSPLCRLHSQGSVRDSKHLSAYILTAQKN